MFSGTTKNLGVIGWPIAHSLSPTLQNAALEAAGLDYVYTALPVRPEELSVAVAGLKALHFRGFNVTIPHKQAVLHALDEIEEDAQIIGAVNTVVSDEGKLKGYNTDVTGFLDALSLSGFRPEGQKCVLFGAGGAARAVLWGLIKSGVRSVTVGARHPERAEALTEDFAARASIRGTRLAACHFSSEEFLADFREADLIVNATPLGMTPNIDAMPPVDFTQAKERAFAYDIIYTPAETKFLREARLAGHPTLNGEMMLVLQGAAAFRLWTDVTPDTEAMKLALRQALATK